MELFISLWICRYFSTTAQKSVNQTSFVLTTTLFNSTFAWRQLTRRRRRHRRASEIKNLLRSSLKLIWQRARERYTWKLNLAFSSEVFFFIQFNWPMLSYWHLKSEWDVMFCEYKQVMNLKHWTRARDQRRRSCKAENTKNKLNQTKIVVELLSLANNNVNFLTITASHRSCWLGDWRDSVEDLCTSERRWSTMKANSSYAKNYKHFLILILNLNNTVKDKVRCMHLQHRRIIVVVGIEVNVFVIYASARVSLTIGDRARCGISKKCMEKSIEEIKQREKR